MSKYNGIEKAGRKNLEFYIRYTARTLTSWEIIERLYLRKGEFDTHEKKGQMIAQCPHEVIASSSRHYIESSDSDGNVPWSLTYIL